MKRFYFCVIAFTISVAMSAATRSVEEAARLAAQFSNRHSQQSHMLRAPREAVDMSLVHLVRKPESDEASIYIFNQTNNNGFVMVSADDNAVTILGYSDKGAFDSNHIPSNVQFWLNHQAERVASAKPMGNGIRRAPSEQKETTPIAPLLGEIEWNQGWPYNKMCPIDMIDTVRTYTGCVVTAGAQIMRYWQWPTKGQGSHSYTWNNCLQKDDDKDCLDSRDTILSATFDTAVYDWANMPVNYDQIQTDDEINAIAQLNYHLGVACDMGYSSSGSGTSTSKLAYALKKYFGYKSTLQHFSQRTTPDLTYDRLASMFESELRAGRPVSISGANEDSGHEFVCDGIDENGLFHINWGWGGVCNGYFALSALDPDGEQGIGGSEEGAGYSNSIECIIGIEPEKNPTHTTGLSLNTHSLTLKTKEKSKLIASIAPSEASNQSVEWTSSNTDIANVNESGSVIGLSAGTTTVIATSNDGGFADTCVVTVLDETIQSTELNINKAWAIYKGNGKWFLKVYDYPSYQPWIQAYIYTGSDNKIAGTYQLAHNYNNLYCWLDPDSSNDYIKAVSGDLSITCKSPSKEYTETYTYTIDVKFIDQDFAYYTLKAYLDIYSQDSEENYITLEDTPDGIDEVSASDSVVRKAIENGRVVIIRGDEKYTVLGQKIQ